MQSRLEEELKTALPELANYDVVRFQMSGDFIRTPDFTIDEIMALEAGISVDAKTTTRHIQFQRVRNVLWYCLMTHRDPFVFTREGEQEVGTVLSVALAAALCREFLESKTEISALTTPRTCVRYSDLRSL